MTDIFFGYSNGFSLISKEKRKGKMETIMTASGAIAEETAGDKTATAGYQAFRLLQFAFVVAPIAAGLDKFFHVLVNWDQYLPSFVNNMLGGRGHEFMYVVGVIEIVAGIGVFLRPKIFAYVVMLWLLAIIVNLLMIPGYFDVALRDLGLAIAALALARLSREYA